MSADNKFGKRMSELYRAGHFVSLGLASRLETVPASFLLRLGLGVRPREAVERFNEVVVNILGGLAGAFRLGIDPYVEDGLTDLAGLRRMIDFIRVRYPWKMIILDCSEVIRRQNRSGGIFAVEALRVAQECDAEAVVVGLCEGDEAVAPIFKQSEIQIFARCSVCDLGQSGGCLCFSHRKLSGDSIGKTLGMRVCHTLDRLGNSGLMFSADRRQMVSDARSIVGGHPLIISGVNPDQDSADLFVAGLDICCGGLIIDLSPKLVWNEGDFATGARRISLVDEILQQKCSELAA